MPKARASSRHCGAWYAATAVAIVVALTFGLLSPGDGALLEIWSLAAWARTVRGNRFAHIQAALRFSHSASDRKAPPSPNGSALRASAKKGSAFSQEEHQRVDSWFAVEKPKVREIRFEVLIGDLKRRVVGRDRGSRQTVEDAGR